RRDPAGVGHPGRRPPAAPSLGSMHEGARRRLARGLGVLVATGALATPACGTGEEGQGPGTAAARPAGLRPELLTLEEARARPVLGMDVRVQPVVGPADLDVTRLDGPCGGSVGLPTLGGSQV